MRSITSKLSTSPAYRMTRRIRGLAVLAVLALAGEASAQTPIIIGPSSAFVWDMPSATMTVAVAQGCTYPVSVNGAAFAPLVGPVTCTPPVPPSTLGPTCSVLVSAQPPATFPVTGTPSITMEATCSGITTLPSAPFAYVVIVIPIPVNLRIR